MSATIFSIIPLVIGVFFCTGLARVLFRPWSVSCTTGLFVGELIPARPCTQTKVLTASSAADLDLVCSARCCGYSATWCACVGKVGRWWLLAHDFLRLNAPTYFLADELVLLCSNVAGSWLASLISSGSSSSASRDHSPCCSTSTVKDKRTTIATNWPSFPCALQPDVGLSLILLPDCITTAHWLYYHSTLAVRPQHLGCMATAPWLYEHSTLAVLPQYLDYRAVLPQRLGCMTPAHWLYYHSTLAV